MKFATLHTIANPIATGDYAGSIAAIESALRNETGKSWRRDLIKLKLFLQDGKPRFTIVKHDGNGKLPFAAFSGLPGKGFCPGAGDCLKWCYSFRAWRYPAAFARQLQNTVLLDTPAGRAQILASLDSVQAKHSRALARLGEEFKPLDFRLYVDGDFRSHADIEFWFQALADRPTIHAYGYSKSLELLNTYQGPVPINYLLNLSGGHRYSAETEAYTASLEFTRGAFRAVNIGRKVHSSDHGTRETNRELRAAYPGKSFQCPGKCGECTPRGHACGRPEFRGVDIIIAVH